MTRIRIILETSVPDYTKPKEELEQYRTPPEIAIDVAQIAAALNCRGNNTIDFGSGTGMLTYALALTGFKYIVGVDIDADAVKDARRSPLYSIQPNIDFIVADVRRPPLRSNSFCVVENPPFGLRSRRGADREFLESAMKLNPHAIVSIHHGSEGTMRFLEKICRDNGYKILRVFGERFPLRQKLPHHWKRIHYIRVLIVACIRVRS